MVATTDADFSGYATKANLKCSDGRTIMPGAFKHQDQVKVPLVWQHAHNEPDNVLGHALLEARDDGVYCYGFFNDTAKGQGAKKLVLHEDITSLSIYANKLVEESKKVLHGMIREVSLVLAGANEGAKIDFVNLRHSDGEIEELDDEAIIFTGLTLEHSHSQDEPVQSVEEIVVEHEDKGKTVKDVFDTLNEEQKNVVYYLVGQAVKGDPAQHSDAPDGINEIMHSLTEEQQNVVALMVSEALERAKSDDDANDNAGDKADDNSAAHADNKEGTTMTHNVFESDAEKGVDKSTAPTLSHDDMQKIFAAAKKGGSLKDAVVDYAATLAHGIDNIDVLFPDAKAVTSTPDFLARRTEWVAAVMSGTRHTPFSRIKSLLANLTYDEARAKGYIKGNLKKEEFFAVSKRVTTPQTIYKKQQLDRDDVLDITDFDVVAWLKGEMRLMLEEEIARAVLLGDGRSGGDDDKIVETNVRPIATDDDLYVTKLYVNLLDASSSNDEIIDAIVLRRSSYRGSGTPSLFCGETMLAQLLSIKDTLGRRIYPTVNDLLAVLRVKEIIPVEVMDNPASNVAAIIVNLQDYTIGADRGGDVAMFDDFDIDYNQQKYLIETRISGALTKAKSAIVIMKTATNATLVDPVAPSWNSATHQLTVATTTGVTYKNRDTGSTLTTGSPVTLSPDEELVVIAVPSSSSYYLASNLSDEFRFTYENGRTDVAF